MIPNHNCAALSDLDMRIAMSVPPGGNWRDIPLDIPSERLAQIRVSAAAGEGSRSTYYGRLRPDRPAYTINTYYNRPGNGCFLHYDVDGRQNRTLSHREAARLQSFPDNFVFKGPQRAVCQQIGNAVPPLLAFQIAGSLGKAGEMVDVFAGAGGLSLGFEWAGWHSIAAVDNDRYAIETFNSNIKPIAFVSDMNAEETNTRLLTIAKARARRRRLALIGGPPCQGFSTGGKKRSPADARNGLYSRYAALLSDLRPDIFLFENVVGLLSLDKGKFVDVVLKSLRDAGYNVGLWRINAAQFGVPQRRNRVFIVGVPLGDSLPKPPTEWTSIDSSELFGVRPVCTASEALNDLPALNPGQDGSFLSYRAAPESDYQRLVRGHATPHEYLASGRADDPRRRSGAIRRVARGAQPLYGG